jgi:UDP-3-O-[3-hydroxymyristoyl] glucosamine N-acyltransferase
MADKRFFDRAGPFSIAEIAERSGAEPASDVNSSGLLSDVSPLETASADDLTFLDNTKYLDALADSRAGACIMREKFADRAPAGMSLLFSDTPYKAYALAAQAFYPQGSGEGSISPSATIDPAATVGSGTSVGPGACIGASVVIGEDCQIAANVVIGDGVTLGDGCEVGANVSVSHSVIGNRVRLYPGVRIGQDGFGFAPDPSGHVKVPQLGRVIIHDDVEIGANSCVDRGSGPDTVIGEGCWIDNLVQIGHNVQLGRGCILVAQSGVAGSSVLGDFVVLGGQVAVSGHLNIGIGAQIAGQSGVVSNVEAGAILGGTPAQPLRDWHRQSIILAKMVKEKRTRK